MINSKVQRQKTLCLYLQKLLTKNILQNNLLLYKNYNAIYKFQIGEQKQFPLRLKALYGFYPFAGILILNN
jgi:hypothetical protein